MADHMLQTPVSIQTVVALTATSGFRYKALIAIPVGHVAGTPIVESICSGHRSAAVLWSIVVSQRLRSDMRNHNRLVWREATQHLGNFA